MRGMQSAHACSMSTSCMSKIAASLSSSLSISGFEGGGDDEIAEGVLSGDRRVEAGVSGARGVIGKPIVKSR
jgi:hypothetical protein